MSSITVNLALDNHRGWNEPYEFQTTLPESLQPTRLDAESFARSMHNFNTAYDWHASLDRNLPRYIAAFLFSIIGAIIVPVLHNVFMQVLGYTFISLGVINFAFALVWHYFRMRKIREQLKRAIEIENEYYRSEEWCNRQDHGAAGAAAASASSIISVVWFVTSHLFKEEPLIVCTVTDSSVPTQDQAVIEAPIHGQVEVDQVHQLFPSTSTPASATTSIELTASMATVADIIIDVHKVQDQQLREPLIYPRIS